jgi:hypothetical protein
VLGVNSFSREAAPSTSVRAASDGVIFKLTRPVYDTLLGPAAPHQG